MRNVHPLLFAAGECRRRQCPQPLGNVETAQQRARLRAGFRACRSVRNQGLRHHVDGGDPRHRTQELADISDSRAAHTEHLPRLGRGKIDHRAPMPDANPPRITAVIAKDHFQDRGFAGA